MEAISDVTIEPCTKSRFIQPYRVRYKQVSYCVVKWSSVPHSVLLLPLFVMLVCIHGVVTLDLGRDKNMMVGLKIKPQT